MSKKIEKDDVLFSDYRRWCHIIMCGIEVEIEDCRKCNPRSSKKQGVGR